MRRLDIPTSGGSNVIVFEGLVVDAAIRRAIQLAHLPSSVTANHQRFDIDTVSSLGSAAMTASAEQACRSRRMRPPSPEPDTAVEALGRQIQFDLEARLGDQAVPAGQADGAIADIGGAGEQVHCVAGGTLLQAIGRFNCSNVSLAVVVLVRAFVRAPFKAVGEIVRRVRTDLRTEQVERRGDTRN